MFRVPSLQLQSKQNGLESAPRLLQRAECIVARTAVVLVDPPPDVRFALNLFAVRTLCCNCCQIQEQLDAMLEASRGNELQDDEQGRLCSELPLLVKHKPRLVSICVCHYVCGADR